MQSRKNFIVFILICYRKGECAETYSDKPEINQKGGRVECLRFLCCERVSLCDQRALTCWRC